MTTAASSKPDGGIEDETVLPASASDLALRQANQLTFSRDLEFLSSLANPYYLNNLAVQGALSSPAFLRYLNYLNYFRHPSYVKYLQYPQALHFLDLLQEQPEFRLACADVGFVNEVMARQVGHWATWRNPDQKEEDQLTGQDQAQSS